MSDGRGNSLARVRDLRHEILHFLDEIGSGENFRNLLQCPYTLANMAV